MLRLEFYETIMGRRFYEETMPKLIKTLEGVEVQLKRIADVIEEEVDIVEDVKKVGDILTPTLGTIGKIGETLSSMGDKLDGPDTQPGP